MIAKSVKTFLITGLIIVALSLIILYLLDEKIVNYVISCVTLYIAFTVSVFLTAYSYDKENRVFFYAFSQALPYVSVRF